MLVGNTFPLVLVRRECRMRPADAEWFKKEITLRRDGIASFWGHSNTLNAVNSAFGVDLTPKSERPAIGLSENLFPLFEGREFRRVWVINPDYLGTYRPRIGEEVGLDKITGWTVICVYFPRFHGK